MRGMAICRYDETMPKNAKRKWGTQKALNEKES